MNFVSLEWLSREKKNTSCNLKDHLLSTSPNYLMFTFVSKIYIAILPKLGLKLIWFLSYHFYNCSLQTLSKLNTQRNLKIVVDVAGSDVADKIFGM